jgi:transcriptional regulator of acetoin/glycerol metabolism
MSFGYVPDVPSAALRELSTLRERQEVELRTLVARAVDAGERSQDIADALGMSRSTLWRRYGSLLRRNGARSE